MRIAATLAAAAALVFAPAASADVVGQLAQLGGTAGCYTLNGKSEVGAGDCTDLRNGDGPSEVAISPDGRFAYAAEYDGEEGLLAFSRDPATGALTQLAGTAGCLNDTGSGEGGPGSCTDVRALEKGGDGRGLAFSADGRFLYAASQGANAILTFARDLETGRLTQLPGTDGCVSRDGTGAAGEGAGTCADGVGLEEPASLTLTPNGRHLLAWSYGTEGTLTTFSRDPGSGKLTQLPGKQGCMSSDGAAEGVAGACRDGRTLGKGIGIAVSPDGRFVYAAGYPQSLTSFSLNPDTGVLTQLPGHQGCMTEDGAGEAGPTACADGRAINPFHMVMSPDGAHLYVDSFTRDGFVALRRDSETGVLTQLAGKDGCITSDSASEDGPATCTDGRGVDSPYAMSMSPDGRNLYAPAYNSGSLAVFARDAASGRLTQLESSAGCISKTGAGGPGDPANTCVDGRAMTYAYSTTVSPDGAFVYLAAFEDDAIDVFARQVPPTCSPTAATVDHGGTVTIDLPCRDAHGEPITRSIVSGPSGGTLGEVDQAGGKVTYTARTGFSGRDTFTFRAADAVEPGAAQTATIDVGAAPAANPPVPPQPQPLPTPLPPDTTRPSCARTGAAPRVGDLLRGRLRLRLQCDEVARLSATLTMSRADARRIRLLQRSPRRITLGRGTASAATAGRAVTLTMRISKRTRARLKRAGAKRLRGARMTLRLVATDAAGNRSTTSRRLRLRR